MLNYPMPPQASTWAERVDWVNTFITDISIICILAITGAMLYFAIKYRRKSDDQETAFITHSTSLETVWTIVPALVCVFTFYYGFDVYREMRTPPANAIEVNVTGSMWKWDFEYTNGKRTTNELVVPLGQAVRLIMRSKDVTHSFYVPALRIKEDVLGNIYTYQWFTATKLGDHHIFCTEYCGTGHSKMLATLKVVTPEAFQDFLGGRTLGDAPELPPAELGKLVIKKQACDTCHSIDGSAGQGPTFKGLFGSTETLADGTSVTVDENYIRESILNPGAKVVKGYNPIMQSYEGFVSDKEIDGIIAYLKTVK